jgi:hypothetical protein
MHGLQILHDAKFEKLGWMAKAKEYGMDLKIKSYFHSLDHLEQCITNKIKSVHCEDSKEDLEIMLENVKCLQDAAHKLLDGKTLLDSSKCKKCKAHEVTFYGIHKWEKHMYEKLGWMVLAKKHGNTLKIQAYNDSIHRLKASLEKKMEDVEENDRKDDIKILYNHVCILHRASQRVLGVHMDGSKSKVRSHTLKSKTIKSKKSKSKTRTILNLL